MKTQQTKSQERNHRIRELSARACMCLDEILPKIGISYKVNGNRLYGCCPVHSGNNPQAWTMYPDGHTTPGIWQCFTRQCHVKHGHYLLDLIVAIKVKYEVGYTKRDAIDWLCHEMGFPSIDAVPLPDSYESYRRKERTRDYYFTLDQRTERPKGSMNRYEFRNMVEMPAPYYVKRGFSPESLTHFDVGYSKRINRVIVPVYDEDFKHTIGFVGRSVFDKCEKCQLWHSPDSHCPTLSMDQIRASKWINIQNFETGQTLYNIWHAKQTIAATQTAVLVEGPPDVWRLHEAGIKNAVAMFGLDIGDEQIVQLMMNRTANVIILTDNDEAGINAAKCLREKLHKTFRLYFPTIVAKDIGDENLDQVTKDVMPHLNKVKEFWETCQTF